MNVAFYFDHNTSAVVAKALRQRGVDVLTAAQDNRAAETDEDLLTRATNLGRVLVTHDRDFLQIASDWQRRQVPFAGVIWIPLEALGIGDLVEELAFFSQAAEISDCRNCVCYLPLKE